MYLPFLVCSSVSAHSTAAAYDGAPQQPAPHTVSGFSSGASLALLHFVAHSASCGGVGIIGGSPYGCQLMPDSQYGCSGYKNNTNQRDPSIDWAGLQGSTFRPYLLSRAAAQLVDPLSNLARADRRAYLFSGLNDKDVFQEVMLAVRDQLLGPTCAMRHENVHAKLDIPCAHSFLVDNETCAAPGAQRPEHCCGTKTASTTCTEAPVANVAPRVGCCGHCNDGGTGGAVDYWKPPVNNCDYDMAGTMLSWLEPGATAARARAVKRNLLAFDQQPYMPPGFSFTDGGFAERGFAYVPTACRANPAPCAMHVHYHPCGGNHDFLNTSYMLENGMAAFAESNRMIILQPQANSKRPGDEDPGCWDWYGGINDSFDTKDGVQIRATLAMMAGIRAIIANHSATAAGIEAQPHRLSAPSSN